jgi:hypothetical protein
MIDPSFCHSDRSGEWSERDERRGRQSREGSGERVGRRASQISSYSFHTLNAAETIVRDVSTSLDMTNARYVRWK